MKTQTLKFNELGHRLKTKLLLLCISIVLFNGACKRELYDNNIAPPSQKDRFLAELYNNLLKNDAQYHILNQLQPSDKLGWERMMVRFKGGKTAPLNYVLPVISQGTPTDRLLQFSFSSENKLVNICLLSYNNNLRLPIASDSLNSNYVKNQQTGNILACMSKNGLVVSDKLTKRAVSIIPFEQQKIAADKNLMQPKPQTLMAPSNNKGAAKPISANANIMAMNNGVDCATIVDFDFLFVYYSDNVIDFDPLHYNTTAFYFGQHFRNFLTGQGYGYQDNSTPYHNEVAFIGLSEQNACILIGQALDYAAYLTASVLGSPNSSISYYSPIARTQCLGDGGGGDSGGGMGPNINTLLEIDKTEIKAKHPCWEKLISKRLDTTWGYLKMVEPFLTDLPKPSLIWKASATEPWGQNGIYSGGYTGVDPTSNLGYSSIITLNSNMITNASQILIAAVSIHETMHAYINYHFAAQVEREKLNKSLPSYMSSYTAFLYGTRANGNFQQHFLMMADQFDNMTSTLYNALGKQYTVDECRMAMLFGMDNAGTSTDLLYNSIIQNTYSGLLTRYGITEQALNTWNIANVNAPIKNKLPNTCQ